VMLSSLGIGSSFTYVALALVNCQLWTFAGQSKLSLIEDVL